MLLADGRGGFLDAVKHVTPARPWSLSAGDVNNDGHPDLVAALSNSKVLTLLGDGTGAFPAQVVDLIGPPKAWAILGDVTGDGNEDLIAAATSPEWLVLHPGDGTGHFGTKVFLHAGLFSVAALGLLDGDSHTDIIAANNAGEVVVLHGDGTGSFPQAVTYTAPGMWHDLDHIFVADLDGDGHQDAALTHFGGVSVLLGDGQSGLQAPIIYSGSRSTAGAALADINGDGAPDLLSKPSAHHSLVLRLGDGAGGFPEEQVHAVGGSPIVIGTYDLTGNGYPDAVMACSIHGPDYIQGDAADPTEGFAQTIRVLENLGGPWIECMGGVAGTNGALTLTGEGSLAGGLNVTLQLEGALENAPVWLIVASHTRLAPLWGGVLVPRVEQLLGPLLTDPAGSMLLTGPVPPGIPPGTPLSMQAWVPDPGGPFGWSASNGIVGITP